MRISDWSSDVCSSDLGCGAHVAELRRLWVDPFREPRLWTLEALQALAERGERGLDACLLPVESGMASWPAVEVDAAQAARLDRKSVVEGKSVSVRVCLGGCRHLNKKTIKAKDKNI